MSRIVTCSRCGFAGAVEVKKTERLPDGNIMVLNTHQCPACDGFAGHNSLWFETPFLHPEDPHYYYPPGFENGFLNDDEFYEN